MSRIKFGSLSINIVNDSGKTASYAIFCKGPEIVPAPDPSTVITKVITSLRGVPNGTGEATCTLPHNSPVAICGINAEEDQDGSMMGFSILDSRPVVLAQKEDDGTQSSSSQLSMILDDDTPQFSPDKNDLVYNGVSGPGSFTVETPSGFTCQQAKFENYMIGLGLRTNGPLSRRLAPYYASFTPAPSTVYQVTPSNTYFVVCGKYARGSIVTTQMERMACKLDLAALGSSQVQLRHTEQGSLVVCGIKN